MITYYNGVCCADVFAVCATHALSTESEEVMGLLLGDITVSLRTHRLS